MTREKVKAKDPRKKQRPKTAAVLPLRWQGKQMDSTCKSEQKQLEEYSYLWTSGEWTLVRMHQNCWRVVLVFSAGHPSTQELSATRTLVPKYRSAPITVLKAELGTVSEFIVGDLGGIEARNLLEAAHKRGLQTRIEDTSYTVYLPMSATGNALIIEDDELARQVTDEMLRRGVPVVSYMGKYYYE